MHEQTITIKHGQHWYNIPTVEGKTKMSDSAASEHAIHTGKLGTPFESLNEAVDAAKKRSKSFNKK